MLNFFIGCLFAASVLVAAPLAYFQEKSGARAPSIFPKASTEDPDGMTEHASPDKRSAAASEIPKN